MKRELTKKTEDKRLVLLRPVKGGEYEVFVAGAMWGYVVRWQHGQRGSSYTFTQIGAGQIYLERKGRFRPGTTSPQPAKVYGDKMERHRTRGDDPAPLEERLLAYTVTLVEDGHLRKPEDVTQERHAAAKAAQARAQQQNAAREQSFRDRAGQALQIAYSCMATTDIKGAEDAIMDAMLWAQTR